MAFPEFELSNLQHQKIKNLIARRIKGEPVAYLTGHKEFYGLDFFVDGSTLIPRPETELLVEEALRLQPKNAAVIDIGTGSGNIIISLAKNIRIKNYFFATDMSPKALTAAKRNAKKHRVDGKIRFLRGDLLSPFLKPGKLKNESVLITANLPYLSGEIYRAAPADVRKYEPKSALYSAQGGLAHYRRLLGQIGRLKSGSSALKISIILEISPEQKKPLTEMIGDLFPAAKIAFKKDLAGKWRVCRISLR